MTPPPKPDLPGLHIVDVEYVYVYYGIVAELPVPGLYPQGVLPDSLVVKLLVHPDKPGLLLDPRQHNI